VMPSSTVHSAIYFSLTCAWCRRFYVN